MTSAVGIHDHPWLKTGLRPTDPAKPILELDRVLTGVTPVTPPAEDRFAGVTFALDGNDTFGTCGPTSVDNHRRSTSKVATGVQRSASLEQVFALYRASGNPNFDPSKPEGGEDNGVEMGSMCDALMKVGLAGDKPVAFGRVKDMSDEAIERLVAVFGGVLFAVTLKVAQQAQSDAANPVWDFKPSGDWGGHAIYNGKYRVDAPGKVDAPVISWMKEIGTTDSFRARQLDEVWVVIWPWHLEHPAFLEGVDLPVLQREFKELTGKVLPLPTPVPPGPEPVPVPPLPPGGGVSPDSSDRALWSSVEHWVQQQHLHGPTTKPIVADLKVWATAKGLL